jgi:hypothetical protein
MMNGVIKTVTITRVDNGYVAEYFVQREGSKVKHLSKHFIYKDNELLNMTRDFRNWMVPEYEDQPICNCHNPIANIDTLMKDIPKNEIAENGDVEEYPAYSYEGDKEDKS